MLWKALVCQLSFRSSHCSNHCLHSFYSLLPLVSPIYNTVYICQYHEESIHPIHVMDDKGMLRVVQAQQVQVSKDGGLNDIPIEAATTTVRALSIACR